MSVSPFPSPSIGTRTSEVTLDSLNRTWIGGRLWLQTTLYHGANAVHAPDFEAASIWEANVPSGFVCEDRGTARQYVAYVEIETITEWSWLNVADISTVPTDWLWDTMPQHELILAFECQSGRTVFSYEPEKLIEWVE